jgi:hypothetical protein
MATHSSFGSGLAIRVFFESALELAVRFAKELILLKPEETHIVNSTNTKTA